MHEAVELVKALRWPCVVIYLSVRFGSEIGSLLVELTRVVRRVRSARALGIKFEFEQLEVALPVAERETPLIRLKNPVEPRPSRKKGD
jgi:hypothetical protein